MNVAFDGLISDVLPHASATFIVKEHIPVSETKIIKGDVYTFQRFLKTRSLRVLCFARCLLVTWCRFFF